jgi:peptide/nickel transport system substrate-binding protein
MDPLQQRETTTSNVLRHFYDPLLERNGSDPQKFDPVLATSWKQLSPTTTRFTLRKGVKFSDGSPFNAQSVKYTFEYLAGKLPSSKKPALLDYQYGTIKTVKVVSPDTVDIVTDGPDPLLLSRLGALLMVPNHAVDSNPNALAAKPVGTGPYAFVRWDRNNQVVMKAKPNYFLGPAKITNVVFKTMTEASSRLSALQAGTVDLIEALPADNIEDVKSSGNATVETVPSARIASVWLNTLKGKPMSDPRVRLALNYAVDVNTMIKTVMSGYGTRVATFVPPYFADYDASVQPLPYDPQKAKQLLTQAGYANGFSMTMMVPTGRYEFATDIAQAIEQYLGKVGVKVKLDVVDFGVFAKQTQQRDIPQAFFGAWGEDFFNPIDEMQVAVQSGTKGFSWYSNKQVDKLIVQASTTVDQNQQKQLITQSQHTMLQDPPFIFLFAYKDLYGVSNKLSWKPRSDEHVYMYGASMK